MDVRFWTKSARPSRINHRRHNPHVAPLELTGKTIVVTRAAHQAEPFIRAIEAEGGTAILFPTISIKPPDSWDSCDRAIDSLHMYDGIIFTSANGVEFFVKRLDTRKISIQALTPKTICVVGEKTKEAVERFGLRVTTMPEKFTALDLANALREENLRGKSFLFARGNLGKDALPEVLKTLGASVDSVIVYQTCKPPRENVDGIQAMLMEKKIDAITFTSPSTFKNFIELFSPGILEELRPLTAIAVIGPVTAKAVKESGFSVDVLAKESTVDSLVSAIVEYVHRRQS